MSQRLDLRTSGTFPLTIQEFELWTCLFLRSSNTYPSNRSFAIAMPLLRGNSLVVRISQDDIGEALGLQRNLGTTARSALRCSCQLCEHEAQSYVSRYWTRSRWTWDSPSRCITVYSRRERCEYRPLGYSSNPWMKSGVGELSNPLSSSHMLASAPEAEKAMRTSPVAWAAGSVAVNSLRLTIYSAGR